LSRGAGGEDVADASGMICSGAPRPVLLLTCEEGGRDEQEANKKLSNNKEIGRVATSVIVLSLLQSVIDERWGDIKIRLSKRERLQR
jgi:hypothetical protein